MHLIESAYAAAPTIHDVSESVSAGGAFWAVLTILGGLVLTLVLLLRRSDLAIVKEAKASLDKLVSVVESFRTDLADLRVFIASNYATKPEMHEVERKLDKHLEHHIPRGGREEVDV